MAAYIVLELNSPHRLPGELQEKEARIPLADVSVTIIDLSTGPGRSASTLCAETVITGNRDRRRPIHAELSSQAFKTL